MSFKITNKGPRSIAVLVPGGPVIVKSGKSESFDEVPTNLEALVNVGAISQEAADKGRDAVAKAEEERRAAHTEAVAAAQVAQAAALTPPFPTAPAAAGTTAGGDKAAPAAQTPAAPAKAASAAPKGGTA